MASNLINKVPMVKRVREIIRAGMLGSNLVVVIVKAKLKNEIALKMKQIVDVSLSSNLLFDYPEHLWL